MIRRPPRSTQSRSSAASDVYKRQGVAAGAADGDGADRERPDARAARRPGGLGLARADHRRGHPALGGVRLTVSEPGTGPEPLRDAVGDLLLEQVVVVP